jgi:hypothetical protein
MKDKGMLERTTFCLLVTSGRGRLRAATRRVETESPLAKSARLLAIRPSTLSRSRPRHFRHNNGDAMRKVAAIFALITSLTLTAPAKKHDSAPKTYDQKGVALAVPTHYEYSHRVDSIGGHYDWACDADAGKLSCTDNPVSYLTYVRLTPDGPMYFALRFSDKQHDAFAPAVLESLMQAKDNHFNYRDYITTAEGLRVICVPYTTTDKKGRSKSGETCYSIDTKNPRQMRL